MSSLWNSGSTVAKPSGLPDADRVLGALRNSDYVQLHGIFYVCVDCLELGEKFGLLDAVGGISQGIQLFQSSISQISFVAEEMLVRYKMAGNMDFSTRKGQKVFSRIPEEKENSLLFVMEIFCNLFEPVIAATFNDSQQSIFSAKTFVSLVYRMKNGLQVFTNMTDAYAQLSKLVDPNNLATLEQKIRWFTLTISSQFLNQMEQLGMNYYSAETWDLEPDFSSTRLFVCLLYSISYLIKDLAENIRSFQLKTLNCLSIVTTSCLDGCNSLNDHLLEGIKDYNLDWSAKRQLKKGVGDRVLALVSNLYYFCNVFFPFVFGVFQEYDTTISETFINEFKAMNVQSVEIMDKAIRVYMKINIVEIERYLSEGLAVGLFDYSSDALPFKARNYIFHVAHCTFGLHATLTKYRSFLTQRIMLRLVEALLTNFYLEIQPLKTESSSGIGILGYVQLKLELLFLQEIFKNWLNETSVEFIQKIFVFIAPEGEGYPQEKLAQHLAGILAETFARTNVMFGCKLGQ